MGLSVIVLETDRRVAESLAGELSSYFPYIHLSCSEDDLRERLANNRPAVVILDVEAIHLSDVRNLHEDFPSLPIVCTHRLPDEDLWVAALEAGASDVCRAGDTRTVLKSALRSVEKARSAVA